MGGQAGRVNIAAGRQSAKGLMRATGSATPGRRLPAAIWAAGGLQGLRFDGDPQLCGARRRVSINREHKCD